MSRPTKRDHHQHHGRERIEHPAQVHVDGAALKPCEVDNFASCSAIRPVQRTTCPKAMSESNSERLSEPMAKVAEAFRRGCFKSADQTRGNDRRGGNQPENLRNGRSSQSAE